MIESSLGHYKWLRNFFKNISKQGFKGALKWNKVLFKNNKGSSHFLKGTWSGKQDF